MANSLEVAKFFRAVENDDQAVVRSMASAHPQLVRANDENCFGATPLVRAAANDNFAMADLLLELGADIDQKSDWWAGGFGPLDSGSTQMGAHLIQRGATLTPHAAARLGMATELLAMLDRDSSLVHARGGDGQTPLHYASTVEIAEMLLAHGANIDALDIDHASTPAQYLGGTQPKVVAYLVSQNAAVDPFIAVQIGDVALLKKTVAVEPDGVNVRVTRERFPAAPPAAGHIYLYRIGEGCTLVHAAAATDQAESIRWLASNGADINARGGYDDGTPLHTAAWCDKPAAVQALIDAGAEINVPSGSTHHNEPLGWAIVGGALGAVRVFVERGAAIREHHFDDARKGAAGAWRQWNPRRPLQAWADILELISRARPSGHA